MTRGLVTHGVGPPVAWSSPPERPDDRQHDPARIPTASSDHSPLGYVGARRGSVGLEARSSRHATSGAAEEDGPSPSTERSGRRSGRRRIGVGAGAGVGAGVGVEGVSDSACCAGVQTTAPDASSKAVYGAFTLMCARSRPSGRSGDREPAGGDGRLRPPSVGVNLGVVVGRRRSE